jgi:hypothetical protein
LLCCVSVAAGVVPDSEGAEAPLRDVLAAALEANRELARLAGELREENVRLWAENAGQAAELEKLRADLAVLQRMVFGRSSERAQPEPSADGGGAQGQGPGRGSGAGGKKRGPGARAGRRDYSRLPGHSRPHPDNRTETATATASPRTRSRRLSACPITVLPNTYARFGEPTPPAASRRKATYVRATVIPAQRHIEPYQATCRYRWDALEAESQVNYSSHEDF